jgi:hypothetical protein
LNQVNLQQPMLKLDPAKLSSVQMANAMAMGDPRMNAKQYDRGGLSRGKAQWNQAGIDSAQKMADGIAEAYNAQLQDQQARSQANLQAQQQQEQYAQNLGALQQQNNYANQMAALQRQGAFMNLLGGLLG